MLPVAMLSKASGLSEDVEQGESAAGESDGGDGDHRYNDEPPCVC